MTFEEVKKLDDTYIMHTFKRKPVCFVEGEGVTVKDEGIPRSALGYRG